MILKNFEHLLTKKKKGAIHVGGHEGQERDWYTWQGFQPVIWFEPNKELYYRLQQNLINYHHQTAFNFGVHDELKIAFLNISSNDGQSSSLLPLGTHTKHHPDVTYIDKKEIKLIRLDNFFTHYGMDVERFNFLNIDVQGVELNVLKSFGDLIFKMDYVYLEVNEEELYQGCALRKDIDDYLSQYGFEREFMQITKHQWGDALYVRK